MYQVCYTRYDVSFYLWLIGSVLKIVKFQNIMNKIVGKTRELRSLERCKILMAVFGLLKYHIFRNVMVKARLFHHFVLEIYFIKKTSNLIDQEQFRPISQESDFYVNQKINFHHRPNSRKIND